MLPDCQQVLSATTVCVGLGRAMVAAQSIRGTWERAAAKGISSSTRGGGGARFGSSAQARLKTSSRSSSVSACAWATPANVSQTCINSWTSSRMDHLDSLGHWCRHAGFRQAHICNCGTVHFAAGDCPAHERCGVLAMTFWAAHRPLSLTLRENRTRKSLSEFDRSYPSRRSSLLLNVCSVGRRHGVNLREELVHVAITLVHDGTVQSGHRCIQNRFRQVHIFTGAMESGRYRNSNRVTCRASHFGHV